MRFRPWILGIVSLALAASIAYGQTTGSISGVVRDTQGAGLPGVTVVVAGDVLPRGRTTTTLADGTFQFFSLLPGTYHLKAELPGLGAFEQDVVVSVQKDTEVRATLRPSASAEVTVTAATPLVDTKSTTASTVTDRTTIEKLPLARTFAGTMELAPGVADSGVDISNTNPGFNAGGGRQDNQFLYDGVNVTNPFFADLFQDFAELDIQEVNITRAGISPEYGRTGGFIVNSVTKSGTNTFHGDVRVEYQPSGLQAESKDPTLSSKIDRVRPGGSAGGPIFKDALFFYGSANFYRQTEKHRFNDLNGPDAPPNPIPDSDLDIDEYFAKLTANPFSNQLLEGSFRYRTVTQTNADINHDAATTGDNPKELDRIIVASWFWTATARFNLEAKFNHNENHNGASPILDFGYQPPFNTAHPEQVGLYNDPVTGHAIGATDLAINNDDFYRDEYKLTGTWLSGFLGTSHEIKAGVNYSANREELARIANGWGSISRLSSSGCLGTNDGVCFRARYSPDQPAQVSKARTWGVFLQDQMTWNRLTVNLGVLVNRDEYIPSGGTFVFMSGDFTVPNSVPIPTCSSGTTSAACTYRDTMTIPWSKQIQPRVGVSYELDSTAHDKLYGNFARYDNLDNQSIARAASPIRLFRTDAFFNLTTGALLQQITRSNNQDKLVLPNIDPTFTDEYLVGYARPLGAGYSVEAYGIYRRTLDVIEDFAANGSNFVDLDPSDFRYGNIPGKRRYRAVTLQLRKAAANDRWTADASYTLSELDGNWDLDYATQLFYSSSYIQDGPGIRVQDQFRQGILEGDRTHVVKIFGTYSLPTNTVIGGYFRFQSGRPWQAQQYDPVYDVPYQYIEPAGSRRTSSWTNLDLLVAQNFPLGKWATFRLEGRLLNVFNTQPALSVDKVKFTDDGTNSTPNPSFGHALTYAQPRRFIATGTLSF